MQIIDLFYSHPYVALPQTAFMIWMLVDAYRKHAEPYWFFLIFFVPFVGAWAYFFLVMSADFKSMNLATLFQPKTSLKELRYRAEHMPTLANHLNLALRLVEIHEFDEAYRHLEAVLKQEPDHATALYKLAVCEKELGHPDLTLPLLDRLMARDNRWSNYQAWHLLIETRTALGDDSGALQACRELARIAPTLQHQCILVEHLMDAELNDEARSVLERALQDYDFAPPAIRRRNRRWANEARSLHKRVPSA